MGVASFGAGVASFGAEVANFGARGFFLIWGGAFLCVGILFLCIGIFMAIGRFVVDAALRKRMAYAVTNKRILISRTGWFPFFTSLDLTSLPDIHLEGDGNARSSLRFGPSVRLYSIGPFVRWYGYGGRGMWVPSLDPTPRFFKIEGAAQVMSLIMKAVEKRRLDDMPPAGAGLSSAVIAE